MGRYTVGMRRANQRGKINTGATALVMVILVAVAGVALWQSGLLPIRMRQDGLYGGGNAEQPPESATVARPKLYLPAPAKKLRGHVAVRRVIDGDTLEMADGTRVRLIGVDCEELGEHRVDPEGAAFKATMYVFSLLEKDPQLKLEYDQERLDKYERTLAYATLPDGRMLNRLLLEGGWADTMSIAPNTRHASEFAKLRDEARATGRGMWAN